LLESILFVPRFIVMVAPGEGYPVGEADAGCSLALRQISGFPIDGWAYHTFMVKQGRMFLRKP